MVASSFKVIAVFAVCLATSFGASAQAPAVQVLGNEIESWFSSDQMAVAGVGLVNGCHWITKGSKTQRYQTIYCPSEPPFTVVGEARVEGDLLCSKFVYPNGSKHEACQEIFRVAENKYEIRVGGVARSIFYRLQR